MFVETKEAGEVQQAPAKVLKLSEAMRIGAAVIPEAHSWCGCAIATAYYAITGRDFSQKASEYMVLDAPFVSTTGYRRYKGVAWRFAEEFGFDPEITKKAESSHNLGMTRLQIADWLESQGY